MHTIGSLVSTRQESGMNGRHEAVKPGTDPFMAAVVITLCVILAVVIMLSLMQS